MAISVLVDAGFLVGLLSRRDSNHRWAASQALRYPPPWKTCDAALSEAFHLLGVRGLHALAELLRVVRWSGLRCANPPTRLADTRTTATPARPGALDSAKIVATSCILSLPAGRAQVLDGPILHQKRFLIVAWMAASAAMTFLWDH